MPVAWEFFTGFEQLVVGQGELPIELEPKVNEYLSLVMRLIFAFGLSFELPVVISLLARVGMVTPAGLRKKRRYAIVIAFVAAAILTPPDPPQSARARDPDHYPLRSFDLLFGPDLAFERQVRGREASGEA